MLLQNSLGRLANLSHNRTRPPELEPIRRHQPRPLLRQSQPLRAPRFRHLLTRLCTQPRLRSRRRPLPFIYDVADLYKHLTSIPAAFLAVRQDSEWRTCVQALQARRGGGAHSATDAQGSRRAVSNRRSRSSKGRRPAVFCT